MFMFLTSLSFSCATIFSGTSTKVKVSGVQEEAKVFYNGNYEGETPLKVKVSKKALKDGVDITIKKNGYQDANIILIRKTKVGAIIGNIIFTGGIGLIIDFATAAIYKPSPKEIKYDLEKES